MNKRDESAFPNQEVREYREGYDERGKERFAEQIVNVGGLTKRELFAAMAMQGMCANMDNANLQNSASNVASEAVRFADALIAELAKGRE